MERHFRNYRAAYTRWSNKYAKFVAEAEIVFNHYKKNQYFDVGYDCTNQHQIQMIEQAIRFSNYKRPSSDLDEDVMLNHPDDTKYALEELKDLKAQLERLKQKHPIQE